ncbi:MAG: hypothetical protein IKU13_10255 [Clostridia bacterium]|nr:hypothetical protein [Clostridia bacterium]
MKKIIIRLLIYSLIIALAVVAFSYTHKTDGMFNMYNIMNGLAYGGLAIIVFCGFLGKKGDRVVVNFMSMPSIGRGAAVFGAGVNLAYSSNPSLMMQAEKPQLETKKTYIDAPVKEDSIVLKITLALLPYIVGIGSMAVGVFYLVG